MARVVNRRQVARGQGVYIGRPGRWGNPYRIGQDGTRDEVIEKYRKWLWKEVRAQRVTLEELAELDDKVLVCYCKPLACHGDVLSRAAAWAAQCLRRIDEQWD